MDTGRPIAGCHDCGNDLLSKGNLPPRRRRHWYILLPLNDSRSSFLLSDALFRLVPHTLGLARSAALCKPVERLKLQRPPKPVPQRVVLVSKLVDEVLGAAPEGKVRVDGP